VRSLSSFATLSTAIAAASFVRQAFHPRRPLRTPGRQEDIGRNTPCIFAGYLLAFLGVRH
jgi:hypothetical protein